ncbi:MAG TPA: FtsL-like putative cell division protein [Flavisolibacter sp.]
MRSNNKKEKNPGFHLRRLLNYRAIVKQIPFFLFLAVLAVIYIYNGHLADRRAREISKTTRELKELQFEYKDVKGDVLELSTQGQLIRIVEPLGLKELTTPPVVLIDSSDK